MLGLGGGRDSSTAPSSGPQAGIRGGIRACGILRLRLTPLSSGSGHIKEVIVAAEAEPGDSEMAEAPGSPSHQGPGLTGEGEQAQVKLLVNKDGRYVCMLCHKTFKTVSLWGLGLARLHGLSCLGQSGWCCQASCPFLPGAEPEPRCPSPTGQHPQGPHGHPQQPQGPRVQAVWGLLPD